VRGEAGSGSDGPARAILIAGVYLDYVQTLVDEVAAVQGVRLWVADQHGTVLATPSGRPPDLVAIQDLSIGSTMLSPRGDPGEIDLDGTAMMVVAHEVETLGWTVVAAIPVAQAQAGADSIRDAVGAVGIPLFLVVAVGIALLVRSQRLQWRAEAAAQAARDAAREASQMKTEFLSRMSHELRTPLNSILGFAQLLEMGDRTATERDSVGHILKAGRHLLDLINEVLDISRIESGTIALSMEPVLMAEIVAETLDIVRPTADQRSVVIENRVDLASHDYALADRQRLKQILLNLLSNAIKYNRPGGRVTVACERSEPGLMRLGVTDTGPGLDEALLGKLFTPFERLGAEQTEVEGTGIGLALSRRLAEALGGELGVESTVGVGSTFWVELPVVEGPVERHERLNDHVGPTSAGPEAPGEHKVLYIEDNLANLDLVERIIAHRESLTVIPCMQGSLAVELAAEHQPALVLLDLHLADMSGEEVLRRLRENEATASIPVVVVSADATSGQVRKLIEAGADAYIAKPIIVVELLRTIDSLIT
jgi:signal transduction histidine kinase/CheY-like chemotaxis protein